MKIIQIFFLVAALTSCRKEETRTCECKDPYGNILRKNTRTGDKQSIKEFEDQCRKDGTVTTQTSSNGTVTTSSSTTTPCELK